MTDWTVGAARDLPIDSSSTWDGQAVKESIFSWAGWDNSPDPAKAKRGFLIYDADEADLKGSYKLPFAHVVGGALKASPAGLRAAASRLPQTDAPQETLDRARSVLDGYFAKLDEDEKSGANVITMPANRRPGGERSGILYRDVQISEVTDDRTFRFIASTNSIDRYQDIIEQEWDLGEFWDNPVLLWSHDAMSPPIGTVTEFQTNDEKTASAATAKLLPEGENEFVDHLHSLLQAKVLRAASVGFMPLKTVDRIDKKGRWVGYRYLQSKLIELSIVTIPANPEAVQIARSLHLPPRVMRTIFTDAAPAVHGPTVLRRQQAELELMRMRANSP